MSPRAIRAWSWLHTWSSLVCTLFLLMLCLTGLPLIFHDEIDAALEPATWQPAHPRGALLDLDRLLAGSLAARPGEVPLFMSFDSDRPVVNVTTGPRADAAERDMHFASWDRTSGEAVTAPATEGGIMHFLLHLHADLFLGLPGMLFLGAMGLLFLVAVISGIALYGPFMRKLRFGTVRARRSARVRWLDYHNLLGIVTVAWVGVVGASGVVNTLSEPIIGLWKRTELADLVRAAETAGGPAMPAPLQAAVDAARTAVPDGVLQFVAFPGSAFSTAHHYAIFLHGATPLTEHVITPVLVDAVSGEVVGVREMPWYVKALSLSRPLHFGDYGGLPLKLVWAALTLMTIVVLASGFYLWLVRRQAGITPLAAFEGLAAASDDSVPAAPRGSRAGRPR